MVTPLSPVQDQIHAWFPIGTHPAHRLAAAIESHLTPDSVILDIGCGRSAPNLVKLIGRARELHGIDLVSFAVDHPDLRLHNADVCDMPEIASDSIDLAYSRAVMEHIEDPDAAFAEIYRVLRPGGRYIFITPSIYDYASLIAAVVPNRWHPKLVHWMTGRKEEDVFPTWFRCNSRRRIERLAHRRGFEVAEFAWLGQYPAYLVFSRILFWIGAQYERMLARLGPLHPLRGWVFCIVEKPRRSGRG